MVGNEIGTIKFNWRAVVRRFPQILPRVLDDEIRHPVF